MKGDEIQLSVLIPIYNYNCYPLAEAVQRECAGLERTTGLRYELIVADDGSTDAISLAANSAINQLPCCRLLLGDTNRGRSHTRNRLAHEARGRRLVFIDSHMSIISPRYIATYLDTTAKVCQGGYVVTASPRLWRGNLRYKYERNAAHINHHEAGKLHPNHDFHTSNFCIDRDVMLAHPFDESISRYGYEDVLMGKRLMADGIEVLNIDNPVGFDTFEDNTSFLDKTDQSIHTLAAHAAKLRGYSRLLDMADSLGRCHLATPLRLLAPWLTPLLRANLQGRHPSLTAFNTYKLLKLLSSLHST